MKWFETHHDFYWRILIDDFLTNYRNWILKNDSVHCTVTKNISVHCTLDSAAGMFCVVSPDTKNPLILLLYPGVFPSKCSLSRYGCIAPAMRELIHSHTKKVYLQSSWYMKLRYDSFLSAATVSAWPGVGQEAGQVVSFIHSNLHSWQYFVRIVAKLLITEKEDLGLTCLGRCCTACTPVQSCMCKLTYGKRGNFISPR